MKGISPVIAFTLLVVIGLIGTMGIYAWIAGAAGTGETLASLVYIQAYAVNSTHIKVVNIDTVNSSSLTALSSTIGDCTFSGATVLEPGIPVTCVLASPATSTFEVYGPDVHGITVVIN